MAESQKQQPPRGPWSVGRHAVPMPTTPANRTPAATAQEQDQTAPPPDRSRQVQPGDSSNWLAGDPAIGFEPLAGSVADTGDVQLSTDASHAQTRDWAVDTTAESIPTSAQTASRSPVFRIVLLLLLLAVL